MKRVHFLLGLIFSISLLLALLVTSIEAALYWSPDYFEKEYDKYGVTDEVNMEMDDLLDVTEVMMDYLKDRREDLQVVAFVDGGWRSFFSQRELDHMVDVKNLFSAGLAMRRTCLIIAGASAVLLYLLKGKLSSILPKSMCIGTGLFFIAVCLLAVIISTDFTKYFTIFHEIFFDNDLWLLNPNKDLLINIVPEPFFVDTAVRIAIIFGGSVLLLLAVCLLSLYHHRQKGRRHQKKTMDSAI